MNRYVNRIKSILIGTSMFFSLSFALVFAQEPSVSDFTPASPDAFAAILQFYQYDSTIPLETKIVKEPEMFREKTREKIVFTGVNDKRVPGYLELPKSGDAPYPCILLIHGLTSSKDEWWDVNSPTHGVELTQSLLKSGFAVAAIDAEYHGERIKDNDYESPDQMLFVHGWLNRSRDMTLHSVMDYRRLMDYLATRSEIDMSQIGVIGYSMGGQMTFLLTAVDDRVNTAVACVAPPNSKTIFKMLGIPFTPETLLAFRLGATSINNFAHAIGSRPFLMVMGKQDNFYTPEEANQLYQLIPGSTKELVFFDSGHILPAEEWVPKAASWIQSHLK